MTKEQRNYYTQQLNDGLEYQDFICDLLYRLGIPLLSYSSKKYQIEKGENKAGFEIKYDKQFAKTTNLWIECYERVIPDKPYVPSGIFRDDWTWLYVIGDYRMIFVFPKKTLRTLYRASQQNGEMFLRENTRKTSKGLLLTQKDAEYYAILIIYEQQGQYHVIFDQHHYLRKLEETL
jgi:hypothetical protein